MIRYGGILAVLILLSGCATYDACVDPKSYIEFLPEQCHAGFNRKPTVLLLNGTMLEVID